MKSFVSLFRKPKVLIGLLTFTFLACVIIIIALFIGQEAGNFVIQVESGNVRKSIRITESLEDPNYTSRLETSGVSDITNTTYSRFSGKLDNYINTDGALFDRDLNVFSYTFYMVNDSNESLDVKATMFYSNVTNNVDKAVRIMTITSQENLRRCYQAPDDVYYDYGANYPVIYNFVDNSTLYEESYLSFDPSTSIKYTVLFWLEGNDPDCTDAVRNGTIRFTLRLAVS